jgi:hypothetical protein
MNKLEAFEIDEIETTDDKFKIIDKSQAEWALRKIQTLKKLKEENSKIVEEEIFKLKQWEEIENKKADESIEYFVSLLQDFMVRCLEMNPNVRSVKLPHGVIRFKKQQPAWIYDDSKILTWLKENKPDLVVIKEDYDKNKLKKLVKETGEIIEGLKIESREDKFEVITE